MVKNYGKKLRGKKTREKNPGKKTGKNTGEEYEKKSRKKYGKIRGKGKGKSHVTSGDVTSGQAQWSDPPQILTELCPYTTHNYS